MKINSAGFLDCNQHLKTLLIPKGVTYILQHINHIPQDIYNKAKIIELDEYMRLYLESHEETLKQFVEEIKENYDLIPKKK